MNIYSIYDSKTKAFSTPFFTVNNATALRSFSDLANDNNSQVSIHAEDFSLHLIGSFDEETGVVTPETPTNLGLAAEYKNVQ